MKFIKAEDGQKLEEFKELIQEVFKLRIQANELEDKAKAKKEEAKDIFDGLRSVTGVDAFETDLGTMRLVVRSNTKFDKDALKDYLIKQGVDSDLVATAFKKASKKGADSESVSFYPPKEG